MPVPRIGSTRCRPPIRSGWPPSLCAPAEASALLRDDPWDSISGLLLCDVLPWHVADA